LFKTYATIYNEIVQTPRVYILGFVGICVNNQHIVYTNGIVHDVRKMYGQ